MKSRPWFWGGSLVLLIQLLVSSSRLTLAADSVPPWKAAAGAVVITPQQSSWMAGYASRSEPSDGQIHDLYAKVLVIEDDGGERLVIVTADLIGITPELRAGIEAGVRKHGIAPNSLLLNASHTHCGPELRDGRIIRYGIDAQYAAIARQYVQSITRQISDLIGDTIQELEPARLIHSRARAGFAMNRRLPTASGFKNSPNPDGVVDHEVPVLRVVNAEGSLKAVLFGYACHATTLGIQQWCGDYPGFAQRYVEAAHPGTVAMFINGCSADQNPYPRRKLELAEQHGRALANGVETALETLRVREIHGPLRTAIDHVTLKFADPPSAEALEALSKSGSKYERLYAHRLLEQLQQEGKIETEFDCFPIQAVQFGDDLTLVAICGEVVVDYALRLKQELATEGGIVWIAGYSNHVFGYLPSARVLQEGGYEGGGAMLHTEFPGPFDETVEQRIIEKVQQLVTQVRTP